MGRAHNDRKSMEGFFAIMDLINDPVKYKAGIDDLIKRHDDAKAMIESIVPAKEIEAARSQAFSKLHEARALVENAKAKAKKIEAEAEVTAAKNRRDAEEQLIDVQDKCKKLKVEVEAHNTHVRVTEHSLKTRQKMAEVRIEEGSRLMEEGNVLRNEFKAKLDKIRNI